ncbi:MAG: bifunctional adenosylcobinamide kinase/adenosylcobinamide-phosphate guanylyltransferase [Clostridia bacterium]|nr:bifunctional adenosylcobinamide kinase/adenosylcobinamide-phosphate guanylyltransferase [Clostridia bacterium]
MMVLITGGSGSGKSTFAEGVMMRFAKPYYYVATMLPYGEEAHRRIERHRRIRAGKGFSTIERGTDLTGVEFPYGKGAVILECVGTLLANEMFEEDGAGKDAEEAVISGIMHLKDEASDLVIVTNEVGSDGYAYGEETTEYMKILGRINIRLAKMADAAIEVSGSQPIFLKGAIR